jgi:hypothetical protein
MVDWDAAEHAMVEYKLTRRVFMTKHSMGVCDVGNFLKQWNQRETSA